MVLPTRAVPNQNRAILVCTMDSASAGRGTKKKLIMQPHSRLMLRFQIGLGLRRSSSPIFRARVPPNNRIRISGADLPVPGVLSSATNSKSTPIFLDLNPTVYHGYQPAQRPVVQFESGPEVRRSQISVQCFTDVLGLYLQFEISSKCRLAAQIGECLLRGWLT